MLMSFSSAIMSWRGTSTSALLVARTRDARRCGCPSDGTVQEDQHEEVRRGVNRLSYICRCGRAAAWCHYAGCKLHQLLPYVAVYDDPFANAVSALSPKDTQNVRFLAIVSLFLNRDLFLDFACTRCLA